MLLEARYGARYGARDGAGLHGPPGRGTFLADPLAGSLFKDLLERAWHQFPISKKSEERLRLEYVRQHMSTINPNMSADLFSGRIEDEQLVVESNGEPSITLGLGEAPSDLRSLQSWKARRHPSRNLPRRAQQAHPAQRRWPSQAEIDRSP